MGYGGEYMYECCCSGTSRLKSELFFKGERWMWRF